MLSEFVVHRYADGLVIHGDSCDPTLHAWIANDIGQVKLIIADPPYGNIVNQTWDRITTDDSVFADWMTSWTEDWSDVCLVKGGAFYTWGGLGKPGFRPFMRYVVNTEVLEKFELANQITWSKKRGYGVQNNYLWTREELAYFVKGNAKKPACFNIPLLPVKRGYAGYNAKYPAKSEFYRRTNVWTDINEMFRGKKHPTQKQQRLHEIIIEVHTNEGDWVIDPFAGIGTTAGACKKLGRKFVVIDSDKSYVEAMVTAFGTPLSEEVVKCPVKEVSLNDE
jgi:DNA modification methylase